MATLIAVYNSEGCVGRCDAKCYNAKHPKCNCVCGGRNHGAGEKQATENTREHAVAWIEEYAQEKGLDEYDGAVGWEVIQPSLYDWWPDSQRPVHHDTRQDREAGQRGEGHCHR